MEVVKELNNSELTYDNVKNDQDKRSIRVKDEIIEINFQNIIDTQFTGGNLGEKREQFVNDLRIGMYSKAPCGGFINLFEVKSNKGVNYVVYSGIQEVSNSHYIVTIHKILLNNGGL
ncbi:MAG TPA: hypothetical protein VF691_21530 [Cytophagaceae bacterium]|jgi:hypothetical protein